MSNEQDPSCDIIRATISDIKESYAVTRPLQDYGDLRKDDSVTFSLANWQGTDDQLQCGSVVELHDTALYRRGWRALAAYPVTPSIQHSARSNNT